MQFYQIPDSLRAEIDELENLIQRYRQGDLEATKFKAHRVPFGIYEQRTVETYMTRIRCTGGGITPAQLKKIALLARQFGNETLHLTTRQELQIHDVYLEDIPFILRELLSVGLSTRGGGGNTVRNIMASWDAGISPDEPFDITPYAVGLTTMLIREPDSWTLPRKYKIAFSNTAKDNAHSIFNDLGFIARKENDVEGFRVFVAGGMGSKPQIGNLLHSFIPAAKIYRVAEAIKKVFDQHGNRKNKHAARLRFLWNKLGEEIFRELYQSEFQALGHATLSPTVQPADARTFSVKVLEDDSPDFFLWRKRFVIPQKQRGLFSILLPVPLGNLPAARAIELADFLEPFGEDVLRCTMEQNLSIRNIPEPYLGDFYRLLNSFFDLVKAPKFFATSIACTGASTCKLGICLPRGAMAAITKKLASANIDLDTLSDFCLNISGCPNSCGAHPKADLGFYGQVGRKGQRLYPSYGIVAGARIGGEDPRLAMKIDSVSARDLPDFVLDFLTLYREKKDRYADVAAYIDEEGTSDIRSICDKYREIPDFQDDRSYYFDWGAAEIFSLVGKGVGECSAGLFDLIAVDLQTIKARQQELPALNDPVATGEVLYQIALSAARMLLVTQGVEARSDGEVFDNFIKYFIDSQLIEKHFLPLLDRVQKGNTALLPALKEDILALAASVERLYAGMDDSMKFHNEKEAATEGGVNEGNRIVPPEEQAQAFKDLRGVSCPMNFVKTKLELAKLKSGRLLRVFLDDGEPIGNVPRSVAEEGHRIAEQIRIDDYWSVLIEKK
jgi:sulfite reductase (ferredoxin)